MANQSYLPFRDAVLTGAINLSTGVLKAALVRSYTFSSSHTFMSDVVTAGGVINGTSAALTNKTISGGVFDADDTTITTTASPTTHVLVVYQASAAAGGADVAQSAQRVCFYIDTGTNIPVAPGTGTLNITWPNTADKIYRLGTAS